MDQTATALAAPPEALREPPLVVDLDGTLILTDLLVESSFALLAAAPRRLPAVLAALARGRAALKARLAADVPLDLAGLPFNEDLLALLRAERARGRRIYLASAADQSYVQALADSLGLFDGIFASDGITNLKGAAKAAVLIAAFGRGGFDYAGNSSADLAVWQEARGVLAVNASPAVLRAVAARFPAARIIAPRKLAVRHYIQALRPHQWLKNLLLLLPGFAAHRFDAAMVLTSAIAFLSFSLCASSVYLLNDLLDLRHDRRHRSKRDRPFASGRVSMLHGVLMFAAAIVGAVVLARLLPLPFLAVLGAYYALTLAYSLALKRQPILDVITLAGLYGMRIVAGGAAVAVVLSPWLLAFSVFLFLCLALVKRSTELIDRAGHGGADPPGRGYRLADLAVLQTMAAASGYVAVLVFILYINSPAVAGLYGAAERLWAIPGILLYWLSRVLILTHRGEMHDDPVVFAARDRPSLACAALIAAAVLASI
jgi:4-hydroxybenzoate polyprenyltransferase/phosphoserine phosphatase